MTPTVEDPEGHNMNPVLRMLSRIVGFIGSSRLSGERG
jgi:hypothetical protein